MRWPGEGAPGDGLRRPNIDEAEGAEAQSGPVVSEILWSSIRSAEVHRDTRCAPTWRANSRGSLPLVVILYRSCVGFGWLAQETTGFRLVWASKE
jgi:hypothetical protein